MIQSVLIIVLFVIVAFLMVTRKIPTLIAMPLMAVGIALIAGVPLVGENEAGEAIGILKNIIEDGSVRMATAIAAGVFGSWFGRLMNTTGVSANIIKVSAELGGDRPLVLTIAVSIAVALLFTVLSGLGSVIMVGTIVIPILISVGIPAATAACIYLFAFAIGGCFALGNWSVYMTTMSVTQTQVRDFSIILCVATTLAMIVFLIVEFKKNGIKFSFSAPAEKGEKSAKADAEVDPDEGKLIKGWRGVMCMISPLIPLVLAAILGVNIVPSFIVAIIWLVAFSSRGFKKSMNQLAKACYDGIRDVAPALILFMGLGMLLKSVMHPMVASTLEPVVRAISPSSPFAYILFFIILAPLSLYRGPMNLFGLGAGIAGLFMGVNTMPGVAVMGAFLSLERVQVIGDPTNTQNVWTSSFAGIDVNVISWKLIPYLWSIAAVGVVVSAFIYF